jgi:hypothetical protein
LKSSSLSDPVGAPDFTLPVSILAQIIESLKVDIAAQSIPKLQINIAGISSGIVFNVAQSGTWTVNVQTASGVSLNVNIASITSGVVFNVAQSGTWTVNAAQIGTWTVNVQTASGVSLNVNIASITSGVVFNVAQSGTWTVNVQTAAGVSLNVNIASITSGVVFNVAQSGTWTVNVQTASGVSLNVNIASITSGVVFNVAQSGTWTVNVQTAAGVSLNVNIASITSGVVFNVAQSGTWTVNVQTAAGVSLNVNIGSISSGVTFNVYITGGTTLNVNISSISSGVTFNVYITGGTTLNVSVTSSVDINVKTSSGANIVIDKLTQGAYTERRSDIYNHGATATMVANNYTYKRGKFFPRGCRGFLQRVWVYCDNTDTVAHTLTVKFSPAPGMGAVYTVSASVAAGSSAAWRYIDVKKFWNYDSMFIWASFDINAYGRLGYDTGTPYDYYYSTDEATWTPDNYRYWIYVTISGETVGDLPVSGTVNTIGVPALSSKYAVSSAYVPQNTETTVLTVKGAGECDMIICRAHTNTYSHVTEFRIYCDEILAFQDTPDNLNTFGFTSSSPGISLLRFTANGDCIFVITKRFGFRSALRIAAYNAAGAAAVSVSVFANLIA